MDPISLEDLQSGLEHEAHHDSVVLEALDEITMNALLAHYSEAFNGSVSGPLTLLTTLGWTPLEIAKAVLDYLLPDTHPFLTVLHDEEAGSAYLDREGAISQKL